MILDCFVNEKTGNSDLFAILNLCGYTQPETMLKDGIFSCEN